MRGVTAIFLAALSGLSSFIAVLSIFVIPLSVGSRKSTPVVKEARGEVAGFSTIDHTLETYGIPITMSVAVCFLGFAWLCWRLANIVWPNRLFAG